MLGDSKRFGWRTILKHCTINVVLCWCSLDLHDIYWTETRAKWLIHIQHLGQRTKAGAELLPARQLSVVLNRSHCVNGLTQCISVDLFTAVEFIIVFSWRRNKNVRRCQWVTEPEPEPEPTDSLEHEQVLWLTWYPVNSFQGPKNSHSPDGSEVDVL